MIRPHPKGLAAILLVLLLSIVLFPIVLMLSGRSAFLAKANAHQKINRSNDKANEAMINDFMSQFSKGIGYYEDHYNAAYVARVTKLIQKTRSDVVVTANRAQRTLLIRARGTLDSDPTKSKGLEVLIKFVPLIGLYGRHMKGNFNNFNTVGRTYSFEGPVRVEGNLRNNGTGNIFFRSFVVVGGDVYGDNNNTRFEQDLYYGGTVSPVPPDARYQAGVFFKTVPGSLVPINSDFYEMNSTKEAPVGTSVWWKFRDFDGVTPVGQYQFAYDTNGDHQFTSGEPLSWSSWTDIPASGGIFLGRNSKTYVSGVVRGAVTVVSLCPPGCNQVQTGTIEITCETGSNPCQFAYADNQVLSDGNNGIFLLSNHGFYMTNPGDTDMNISGCLYSDDVLVNPGNSPGWLARKPNGTIPNAYTFRGSQNNVDGATWFNPTVELYDPQLQNVSAIGLPERPVIVSWRHLN